MHSDKSKMNSQIPVPDQTVFRNDVGNRYLRFYEIRDGLQIEHRVQNVKPSSVRKLVTAYLAQRNLDVQDTTIDERDYLENVNRYSTMLPKNFKAAYRG